MRRNDIDGQANGEHDNLEDYIFSYKISQLKTEGAVYRDRLLEMVRLQMMENPTW